MAKIVHEPGDFVCDDEGQFALVLDSERVLAIVRQGAALRPMVTGIKGFLPIHDSQIAAFSEELRNIFLAGILCLRLPNKLNIVPAAAANNLRK